MYYPMGQSRIDSLQKICTHIGEIRRAISRSTDSLFTSNGYSKQFVRSVIQQTLYTEPQRDNQGGCIYLKLPYIDEVFKRRALATIRRTGIGNIRDHFMNGQQISKIYAPKEDKLSCTIDCAWYLQTLRKDKSVPHQEYGLPHKLPIQCQKVYVGETSRTIGLRIRTNYVTYLYG
jgi:hypothetical protein